MALINIGIICILLIIVLVVMYIYSVRSKTQKSIPYGGNRTNSKTNTDYSRDALYHSTKSVDGERQFTNDTAWKSQPSKCFDCESQLQAQCGDACVYNGTKQKLFSQT